jgi:hypothetical protein
VAAHFERSLKHVPVVRVVVDDEGVHMSFGDFLLLGVLCGVLADWLVRDLL